MNSDVTLVCCLPDTARRLDRAESWLAAFEGRFSRFRPLSELSRLNAAAGRPFHASPALVQLVEEALGLARRTGGVFDPTILGALEDAGYDRSFELVTATATHRPARDSGVSWQDVQVDAVARTITLPAGAGIDLGGIGKGYAIDRLAAILGSPCLVNGGGDVHVAGQPPDEASWRVGVADPFSPERDIIVLAVTNRGVATSSSLRRRWRAGGAVMHHLIDPRTGRPSASDAVQVTAVAATALLADYHAKVALLLGAERGLRYLNNEDDVEGILVWSDGERLETTGLRRYILQAGT